MLTLELAAEIFAMAKFRITPEGAGQVTRTEEPKSQHPTEDTPADEPSVEKPLSVSELPSTAGFAPPDVNGEAAHQQAPLDGTEPDDPGSPQSLSRGSPPPFDDRSVHSHTPVEFEAVRSKNISVDLPQSTLIHPRSRYEDFIPPLRPSKEWNAVASLMETPETQERIAQGEFVEFELDSFSFYVNGAHYQYEMRPLQLLATRFAHDRFYFDGVLSSGGTKHYVQQVEVSELPIGNYDTTHPSVQGQIWVRSRLNTKRDVYYRLGRPAIEYARFYTPFLWVADLAKHAVDYSAAMISQERQVEINSFKAEFMRWLLQTHGSSHTFQAWRRQHPNDDFRTSVAANIDFIWKEMNGVLGSRKPLSIHLFNETIYFTRYKQTKAPPTPMVKQGKEEAPPTIVTQYIQDCFGHMVIGRMLRVPGGCPPSRFYGTGPTGLFDRAPEPDTSPTPPPTRLPCSKRTRTSEACFLPLDVLDQIKAGDTISTPRDGEATGTKWRSVASKGSAQDDRWFGLVQDVHIDKDGSRSFDVSWFYRPVETLCSMMKYPWPNELFLSDHCTCEEGRQARVKDHEVQGVHDVDWFGNPDNEGRGEFFVRQMYVVESRRWVTLERSHLACSHGPQKLGFATGDTVLAVRTRDEAFADPYEVVGVFKQGATMFVRLRRLLRRRLVDPRANAAPNELVYTDQLVVTKPSRIIGKCLVRFFNPGEAIPTPYDRGGTGNLFYITHRLETLNDGAGGSRCVPYDGDFPASLRQGFEPTRQTFRKLRGMDLFCGAGNFGRGLEDGGGVEMRWANDIWDRAIHTYMANSPNPEATNPFLGSVDDLLRLAIEGKYSDKVPRPGEVEFISAGSPCPGFSLLTQDKTTLAQAKNQSLVASFASFVDFYRPKYGILENVSSIVQARHNRSEDVLSQLFCALVGMGYQAQLILGDAWSHGAPQCRNRVFVYFAAPGLPLPEAPLLSHSHYPGVTSRGLGEMCNGEPFVRRSFQPTAFPFVSAGEGTSDLPLIGDGKAEPAIAFPDHRVCAGVTERLRHQIAAIPTHPYGMNFSKAWDGGRGVMTPAERELFPDDGFRVAAISQGWRRVNPGDVFLTVTTRSQPTDARAGTGLHWVDDRPLTVQEIRRAQGFPDCEVLLGMRADQWKLVGNSVARQMALALGMRFREAWAGQAEAKIVQQNGHRQSTPRDVAATTTTVRNRHGHDHSHNGSGSGSREPSAPTAWNGPSHSTTHEIIDLTSEAEEETSGVGHGRSREAVNLTSRSSSSNRTDTNARSATTTRSTRDKRELMKRRVFVSSASDLEVLPPPKAMRLDSAESTPEVVLNVGPGRRVRVPIMRPEPSPPAQTLEGASTGPTVVRLWSPDEFGSDVWDLDEDEL